MSDEEPHRRATDRAAPIIDPVQTLIEVLIGRLTLFTVVSLVVIFAVSLILWVSAIASWRVYGLDVTPQDYSITVTAAACITGVAFFASLITFVVQARKNR